MVIHITDIITIHTTITTTAIMITIIRRTGTVLIMDIIQDIGPGTTMDIIHHIIIPTTIFTILHIEHTGIQGHPDFMPTGASGPYTTVGQKMQQAEVILAGQL
jgi:hypothetical protein